MKIEETAAADPRLTNSEEKDNIFKVIKWVYQKIDPNCCEHSLLFDHDMDYCGISFSLSCDISIKNHLFCLVNKFKGSVRDINVIYPERGVKSLLKIVVELYRKRTKIQNAISSPPIYTQSKINNTREKFFNIISEKIDSSQQKPKSWVNDIKLMHAISEQIHKMAEEVIDTTVRITTSRNDGLPDGSYELEFNNIQRVSYSFFEMIWVRFGRRIGDVIINVSGIDKRIINFVLDPISDNSGSKIVMRFDVDDDDEQLGVARKRKEVFDDCNELGPKKKFRLFGRLWE